MLTKTFSIYSAGNETEDDVQLTLEIGQEHIACLLKSNGSGKVVALELYRFLTEELFEFEQLISQLYTASQLVQKSNTGVTIYVNHANAVVVPAFKFNKEIAEEYLQLAVGSDFDSTKFYDHIRAEHEMMVIYRIPNKWLECIQKKFTGVKFRHSYSNIIEAAIASEKTDECLFLQFYHNQFIVCAMQHGRLLLIQSGEFNTPDDVCYYLLNACNQLDLTGADLSLHLSGMIDLHSSLYRELVKYFHNIHTDTIDSALLPAEADGHPSHYFTPFFKLAL
jgi:hypothetical protein